MSETKQELLMSDISDYVRAKDASVRLQNCIIQICEDLGRFPTVAEVVLRGQKDLSKYSYIGKKSLSDLENLLKLNHIPFPYEPSSGSDLIERQPADNKEKFIKELITKSFKIHFPEEVSSAPTLSIEIKASDASAVEKMHKRLDRFAPADERNLYELFNILGARFDNETFQPAYENAQTAKIEKTYTGLIISLD